MLLLRRLLLATKFRTRLISIPQVVTWSILHSSSSPLAVPSSVRFFILPVFILVKLGCILHLCRYLVDNVANLVSSGALWRL